MKTKTCPSLFSVGAILALMSAPFCLQAADTPADKAKPQAKDASAYILFTGTEVQVQRDQALLPVCNVDGDALIIRSKSGLQRVPMRNSTEQLKLVQTVHLAPQTASLSKYKFERAYSPENDPRRKWNKSMVTAQGAWSDQKDQALSRALNTNATVTTTNSMGAQTTTANPNYASAQQNLQSAQTMAGGDFGSSGFYAQKLEEELAQELYDALEIQFEVSSTQPLASPYVIVVAQYHEKSDKKYVRNWLFAKTLGPVDSAPKLVKLQESGFPRGFVLDKLHVHLYDKGTELATELSENRAPLTREEAHEYLVIEYLSANSGKDSSAKLVLSKAPEGLSALQGKEDARKTYYVKVDKAGRPQGAFDDEKCMTPVSDPLLAKTFQDLLFLPALKDGKEIESLAKIRLSEIRN